jgi:hypothetical protein
MFVNWFERSKGYIGEFIADYDFAISSTFASHFASPAKASRSNVQLLRAFGWLHTGWPSDPAPRLRA